MKEPFCTSHWTTTLPPWITGELAKPHCALGTSKYPESRRGGSGVRGAEGDSSWVRVERSDGRPVVGPGGTGHRPVAAGDLARRSGCGARGPVAPRTRRWAWTSSLPKLGGRLPPRTGRWPVPPGSSRWPGVQRRKKEKATPDRTSPPFAFYLLPSPSRCSTSRLSSRRIPDSRCSTAHRKAKCRLHPSATPAIMTSSRSEP